MDSYEPNRLALNHLIETYEELLPRRKCKMNDKKRENDDRFQHDVDIYRKGGALK